MRFLLLIILLSTLRPAYSNEKVIGFSVVPVLEFKKDWKEQGNEPLKFPPRTGNSLIVASVMDHSPADEAGLQEMDIIRIVNKKLIRDEEAGIQMIKNVPIGGEIELSIVRSAFLGRKRKRITTNPKTNWINKKISIKPVSEETYLRSCVKSSVDMVRELRFTRHKDTPEGAAIFEGFSLYYSESGGISQNLFLRISYLGGDWIFIRKYIIKTDKNTYTLTPASIERDNGILNGNVRVWEWCDVQIDKKDFPMIEDIANSKSVTVRYSGDTYYKDFQPSKEVRDRMLIVLKNYMLEQENNAKIK